MHADETRIAFEYVANQVPKDGYTLAVASTNSLAILPLTVRDMRFDPIKDLPPFVGVGESRLLFGSAPQLPWRTFEELIAYGKSNSHSTLPVSQQTLRSASPKSIQW